MAFYLTTKTGERFEWHIQSEKPMRDADSKRFQQQKEHFDNVLYFQADGDELDHIRNRIHNIPIGYSVFIWRDNLAQLIYDNL